jgi:hypothetical protein
MRKLFFAATLLIPLIVWPFARAADQRPAPTPTVAQPGIPAIEGHLRRDPVLPVSLPDYELASLDVTKEVVFHIGNQTVVGHVPIMVYVPVNRVGRAQAVDRLIEARVILLKSAASSEVKMTDLAAVRDLLEQALTALRSDASVVSSGGGK